jgi:DNA polymerase III delta prime subunit
MFLNILKEGIIPNMLISGPQGCGKTTVAFCLADQMESNTLYINMSLDTGIDKIRYDVKKFISSMSFKKGKKIVIGDEFDRLSPQAMDSLKSTIEEYSSHASFIFTSNHKNKIIPALRSRIQEVDFVFTSEEAKLMKKEFFSVVCKCLKSEGLKDFERKAVGKVIQMYFPDMRKVLNELQMLSKMGPITVEAVYKLIVNDMTEFFTYLRDKDFGKLRKYLAQLSVDYNSFYPAMFHQIHKFVKPDSIPAAVLTIAEWGYKAAFSVDGVIPLTACAIEMMSDCEWNKKF